MLCLLFVLLALGLRTGTEELGPDRLRSGFFGPWSGPTPRTGWTDLYVSRSKFYRHTQHPAANPSPVDNFYIYFLLLIYIQYSNTQYSILLSLITSLLPTSFFPLFTSNLLDKFLIHYYIGCWRLAFGGQGARRHQFL
jgi:hypothetical protein